MRLDMKLVVATGNPGKLKEMQNYLTDIACELILKPQDIDVEETGQTFLENACLKASQVARAMGEWAIADDSGLAVDALNGAPGIYSARYGQTNEERINRLLSALEDVDNRKAHFICAVAIARSDGSIAVQTQGICHGEILDAPRGTSGFGYDPIFYVPEHQLTFAEMPVETKHRISHRGQAFEQILPTIKDLMISSQTHNLKFPE
jgi:XTP/dITP diphosphohydrolase